MKIGNNYISVNSYKNNTEDTINNSKNDSIVDKMEKQSDIVKNKLKNNLLVKSDVTVSSAYDNNGNTKSKNVVGSKVDIKV